MTIAKKIKRILNFLRCSACVGSGQLINPSLGVMPCLYCDGNGTLANMDDIEYTINELSREIEEETRKEMIIPYKRNSVEVIIRVIDGESIETVSRIIPLEEAYLSNHNILLRNCEFAISDLSQGILSKCNWLK